jgi:hypothetical protein
VVPTPAALDLKAATPPVAGRVRLAARLSWVTGALAVLVAAAGLFRRAGTGGFGFTTVRGETVPLYGRGLYHYDTLFAAGGAMGNDTDSTWARTLRRQSSAMLNRGHRTMRQRLSRHGNDQR